MSDQLKNEKIDRRKFFLKLSLGIAGISAAAVAVPVVSALIAPIIQPEPQAWRNVGKVKDFIKGATKLVTFTDSDPQPYAGVTKNSAAWLRKNSETDFIAFAVNCSHLGCPVRWEEGAELFMCPCHGGVYYSDGRVAAGPPPKSLTQYQVRVFKDEVQIKTAPIPLTTIGASKQK